EQLVDAGRLLRVTPALGLDHRVDPVRPLRRWEATLAGDQQKLVSVAAPNTQADPVLDPNEVRLVLEAPGRDHLECLGQKRVYCPEKEHRPLRGGNCERLDLLEGEGRVVALRGVFRTRAAELPGRVGV